MSGSAVPVLAPMLAPPAPGTAPAGGPAPEPAMQPFDDVLADTESATVESGTAEPGTSAPSEDTTLAIAPMPAAGSPPVVVARATPLPAPPAMDDPVTTSVLNALALRVATEAKAAPTGAATVPLAAAAGATGAIGAALPATINPPEALATAITASLAAAVPARAAAASTALGALTGVRGATGGALTPGVVPLAGLDGSASDGGAGSLDALLPDTPFQPVASPSAGGPAAAPTPSSGVPLAPPMPSVPPLPAAGEIAKAAFDALVDPAAPEAVGESAPGSSTASAVVSGAGGAPAFSIAAGAVSSFSAAAPRADGTQPPIQVPFDSPQWGNELATRVVSLAREQFSEAEIRVTPDELGPIEVKLRFEGDRVHAQFGAISPEAREALTANLHRLREMFAGEGLNLGQAFVGHHGQDAGRRFDGHASRGGGSGGEGDDDVAAIAPRVAVAARRGLLDEFA